MRNRFSSGLTLLSALAALGVSAASANQFEFGVSLDTANLAADPSGPFYLELQLNEGSGSIPNTATVDDIRFVNGAPVGGTSQSWGTVSGDLSSSVALADSPASPFNGFLQEFTSSTTSITFDVWVSQNAAGIVPDEFSVALLNSQPGLPEIPTNAPDGVSLVTFNLGANNTAADVMGYATLSPDAHVPDAASTLALLAAGMAGLALVSRRAREA
ncbi:MAG TPA: NF038129 family PEP-CTERM protein [Opitutaceae bacterium]|jgi:hypothetical protein